MDETRFKIIFDKLSEIAAEEAREGETTPDSQDEQAAMDKIDELRKLALEVSEPGHGSYTST